MIIIWVAVDGSDPVRSNILYTASVLARSRNPSSPSLSKLRRRIFHIFPHAAIPFPFSFSRKSLLFVAVPSLISEKLAPMSIKRQKIGKRKKERVSAPLSPLLFFLSLSFGSLAGSRDPLAVSQVRRNSTNRQQYPGRLRYTVHPASTTTETTTAIFPSKLSPYATSCRTGRARRGLKKGGEKS